MGLSSFNPCAKSGQPFSDGYNNPSVQPTGANGPKLPRLVVIIAKKQTFMFLRMGWPEMLIKQACADFPSTPHPPRYLLECFAELRRPPN
jgi:hypothetical protein